MMPVRLRWAKLGLLLMLHLLKAMEALDGVTAKGCPSPSKECDVPGVFGMRTFLNDPGPSNASFVSIVVVCLAASLFVGASGASGMKEAFSSWWHV